MAHVMLRRAALAAIVMIAGLTSAFAANPAPQFRTPGANGAADQLGDWSPVASAVVPWRTCTFAPGGGSCTAMPGFVGGVPADAMTVTPPNRNAEAIARTASRVRYLEQYGAAEDGVTDDLPAFQRAFNDLGANGGELIFGSKGFPLIYSGDLVIPSNVYVHSQNCSPGGKRDLNVYSNIAGTIIVNPAHTIRLSANARLSCFVEKAQSLFQPASIRDQLDMVAGMTGTGITAAGFDTTISHGLILGFGTCYSSTGQERPTLSYVQGDCSNGSYIDNAHDIAKQDHVEWFPFLTTQSIYNAVTFPIAAAADNGSGVWRVTTGAPNPLKTGDTVLIGSASTARGINGRWTVTVIDSTHFDLQNSTVVPPSSSGTTTAGSNVIIAATYGTLRLGMTVSGPGIPSGTTITDLWNNHAYLSQPATATGVGVTFTFADSAYSTTDGTLYVHTNYRAGEAFHISNSEGAEIINSFEYGFQTGAHLATEAWHTHLVNVSFDNWFDPSDAGSVAMKIDSTSTGTTWVVGSVTSYGTPLLVNTTNDTVNGDTTDHTIVGVTLDPGRGLSYQKIMPTMDFEQGRLTLIGTKNNVNGGATMRVGSDAGITSLGLSGNFLPTVGYLPWNAAAVTATHQGNVLQGFAPAVSTIMVNNSGNAQTIPANSSAPLTLGTAGINVGANYNTANSRWTPPAGNYRVSMQAVFTAGVSDQANMFCGILKNGNGAIARAFTPSGSGTQACTAEGYLQANGSDYLQPFVFNGGSGTLTVSGDPTYTYFAGSTIQP